MSFGLAEEQPGAGGRWSFFQCSDSSAAATDSEARGSDGGCPAVHVLCDVPSVSCSLAMKGMYGSSVLFKRQVAFGQDSRMFADCF